MGKTVSKKSIVKAARGYAKSVESGHPGPYHNGVTFFENGTPGCAVGKILYRAGYRNNSKQELTDNVSVIAKAIGLKTSIEYPTNLYGAIERLQDTFDSSPVIDDFTTRDDFRKAMADFRKDLAAHTRSFAKQLEKFKLPKQTVNT